jgi:NDP-4-keto-2,6-dideoxyhexose 3-C-methyltransferase
MNLIINEAKKCRVCNSKIKTVADFGEIYINDFPKQSGEHKGLAPMTLDKCQSCGLVQLRHTVDPDILYGDHYWYESALNPKLKQNLLDIAEYANEHTEPGDAVLDIGANDGTLLSGVTPDRIRIGCEPASNLWSKCAKHCDVLLPDMWDSTKLDRKCKFVTAIGMFYDMDDPNDFIQGVSDVLSEDGVFVAQLMTLKPMLEQSDLGNICHEHLEYYSYKSLVKLYEKNGLQINDIRTNDIQGGSYQVWATPYHSGSIEYWENTDEMLDNFFDKVHNNGRLLRAMIKDRVKQGKKAYVYGASTKGNTMLQIWDLDHTLFTGAAEIHPGKIGRYTVGSNIPIVTEADALADADILFAPNFGFRDLFVKNLQPWLKAGGQLVFAMPEVEVITYEEDSISNTT